MYVKYVMKYIQPKNAHFRRKWGRESPLIREGTTPCSIRNVSYQIFQITRFHLLIRQSLLDRRQAQDHSQYCRQGAVIQITGYRNQVLQVSRSRAIMTTRCTEFTGVMTRSGRARKIVRRANKCGGKRRIPGIRLRPLLLFSFWMARLIG